jgi:hypothetical protein
MPVAVLNEMDGVTAETYDAVNDEMDVRGNPPEGLIFHTGGPKEGGGWRIFDVWQDEASFQRFEQDRLGPAVQKVTQGQPLPTPPRREIYQLHGFVTA